MKVDVVYFTDGTNKLTWPYGEVKNFSLNSRDVINEVNAVVGNLSADWVLFWDATLGAPDDSLIAKLINSKVDAWHAGLKLGLAGLPKTIDYVNPAWIYNKDADDDIISSSFRLSIKASLIKIAVYNKIGGLSSSYESIDSAGLAFGYSIIKSGGIIRYHPDLVIHKQELVLPAKDEWVFLKEFFPKKWQYWVLLNKNNRLANYTLWRKLRHVKYKHLIPVIHRSDSKYSIQFETVSVLAPTLDRYEYLENELKQLSVQDVMPTEVLITDQTDGSSRQTIKSSDYPNLDVKCFPQSEKGQCVAWNKLLQEAKGDYVLFLGDDADNIKSDFIAKLIHTMHLFDADIVASNVIEVGSKPNPINQHYYMSDTFPITLAKRDVILASGMMDMFFNKNIRADYDLALRCHENGALMIFDSSALIDHHRAPKGGLRAHKARVITNKISKHSLTKFAEPTSSEMFLVKKHFSEQQFRNYIRIKYFDQLMINGGVIKKLLRAIIFIFKLPRIMNRYKNNLQMANIELKKRNTLS